MLKIRIHTHWPSSSLIPIKLLLQTLSPQHGQKRTVVVPMELGTKTRKIQLEIWRELGQETRTSSPTSRESVGQLGTVVLLHMLVLHLRYFLPLTWATISLLLGWMSLSQGYLLHMQRGHMRICTSHVYFTSKHHLSVRSGAHTLIWGHGAVLQSPKARSRTCHSNYNRFREALWESSLRDRGGKAQGERRDSGSRGWIADVVSEVPLTCDCSALSQECTVRRTLVSARPLRNQWLHRMDPKQQDHGVCELRLQQYLHVTYLCNNILVFTKRRKS